MNIWRKKVFNESIIDEILSKLDRLETLAPEKETSGKSENHIAVNSLNTSASNQEVPALLNDPASLFATLSELGKMYINSILN